MTNIPIIIPTWLLLVGCAGELPSAPTCVDTSVAITLEEGPCHRRVQRDDYTA